MRKCIGFDCDSTDVKPFSGSDDVVICHGCGLMWATPLNDGVAVVITDDLLRPEPDPDYQYLRGINSYGYQYSLQIVWS